MSEVKFEPLFGDQSVFHKDDKESVVAMVYSLFGSTINGFSDKYLSTLNRGEQIIAMRRIIRTPVWTKEDQKAGRLPEVGCEVMVSPKTKATVTAVDSIQKVVAVQCDDESLDILQPCEILPIETEAERQQREREEWCDKASGLLVSHPSRDYGIKMSNVYDALVSGELKMPEVRK